MSTIKISLEEVQQGSDLFRRSSEDTQLMVNTLTAAVQGFASVWEGKAFQSFDQQYNDLLPSINEFIKLLDDIGLQLDDIRRIMEETDAQISASINAR